MKYGVGYGGECLVKFLCSNRVYSGRRDSECADIAAYLADVAANTSMPFAQLAGNQLRAAVWFGISGFVNSEDDAASPADSDWNPLAWAWEQTIEHIARHVAQVTAEDIAQLYNGDRDNAADKATAAALAAMFAIPLDMIAARATGELYKATRADAAHGNADDTDGVTVEDITSETAAISADDLTDPNDVISVEGFPYFRALADAQ